MQHTKNVVLASSVKKTWTTPRIHSIELNSAKNGSGTHGDGVGTGKS